MLDPNVLYEQVICTEVVDYHNNPLGVAKRMDWSVLHLVQGVQGWGSQSCRRGLYTRGTGIMIRDTGPVGRFGRQASKQKSLLCGRLRMSVLTYPPISPVFDNLFKSLIIRE
jgi:hypothetical protein